MLPARLSTFNINKGALEQLKHEPLSVLKSSQVLKVSPAQRAEALTVERGIQKFSLYNLGSADKASAVRSSQRAAAPQASGSGQGW